MTNWQTKQLGEVCESITRGISPKYINEGGLTILNQKCVRNHKISYQEARRHDNLNKSFDPKKLLQVGDVLINSTGTGTLGRVAQVKALNGVTLVDSHITIIRPIKGLFDNHFLGWIMIYIEDLIKDLGSGASGQTELSRETLKQIAITYPESIPEQHRIVKILDEVFEKTAKAKENAEKNLQNSKELFESYLQSVFANPNKNWQEKTLDEISLEFGRGKSKHRPRNDKKLYGGKYPFIQTGDVRNSNHLITDYSQTYNDAGLAQSKLWPKGTICITIAANIAETGILDFEACFPDSVIGLVANPKIAEVDFIEYLLQSLKAKLQAKGKGSAQANINMGTFENELFPFPGILEQKSIVTKLNTLSTETKKLESIYRQKLTALEELKKSVLQKAFSGEL